MSTVLERRNNRTGEKSGDRSRRFVSVTFLLTQLGLVADSPHHRND
jgi:hypothetical protein